jgi:hypothetical protein
MTDAPIDRQALLLMPQRRFKGLLPKMPGGESDARFTSSVNPIKKAQKYMAPIDVTQESVIKKALTVGVVFRGESRIFDNFIRFLEPKEVFAVACTTMKTWRHIMGYTTPLSHKISVRAFTHILKSGNAGILHRAHLLVGRDDGGPTNIEQIESITTYLKQKKGPDISSDFKLIALGIQLKPEITTEMVGDISNALGTSLYLSNLIALSFEGSAFDAGMFTHLLNSFKGGALNSLKTLNLAHNGVYYTAIRKLRLMLENEPDVFLPQLTSLCISATGAELAAIEYFDYKFLRKRPKITCLDVSSNALSLLDGDASIFFAHTNVSFRQLQQIDLSFNPLADDGLLRLMRVALPLTYDPQNMNKVLDEGVSYPLERLVVENSEIADGSILYLVDHMKAGRFTLLHTLHLAMNLITKHGAEWLLEPMIGKKLPALRDLGLGMNNLGDDGMIRFANSIILGALDQIEFLDIAEVGSSLNNINYFAKCLIDRHEKQTPTLLTMKTLKLYGKQPFQGKKFAKIQFPQEFMDKIKVS